MDPSIHQLHHKPVHFPSTQTTKQKSPASQPFNEVLKKAGALKVSRHAEERLTQRNINLNQHQWEAISEKVGEARKKGITESLVITKDAALLVSAKNNTVVTAMNRQEAVNKIFTNIDGTILIEE